MKKASKSDLTDTKTFSPAFGKVLKENVSIWENYRGIAEQSATNPTGFFEGAPPQANTVVAGAEAQDHIPALAVLQQNQVILQQS